MTWFDVLCRALGRDDLAPAEPSVPFAVVAESEISWHEPALAERGAHSWELTAGSPQGLEAVWRVHEHPETRAVECSGTVRNVGRAPVPAVRELRTLDLSIRLSESWGEPFVRTVNGARFLPNFFPPDDFRFHDRQLLRVSQPYVPLSATSTADGRSSGPNLPCAVLAGEAGDRGLALFYEWSGLWNIGIQQTATSPGAVAEPCELRLTAGVWGLALDLQPGEELPLPNLLITGFDGDLDAGGNALRRHVVRHVAPALGGEPALPPTSFNHWFAFRNDFTAESLKLAVDACSRAGLEYFVVDAGWFAPGFRRGIGNWHTVDARKFPDGVAAFARYVEERGMRYGTWFEPEYAHVESELYRSHPEWFLRGPHISPWSKPTDPFYPDGCGGAAELDLGERFALIDFGQAAARQWWIDRIVEAYERWHVRWLKWDFNQQPRPFWDTGAATGRVGLHQINHVRGLYEVLDEVMRACPDLLVEQCSSGGYRIDLGTVRRGHTVWMNDHTTHTDLVRALQHGLNTVLPGVYANTHLCQERFDYTDYDYLSHGGGPFGFSGRLWEAPRADFERYRAAVERFKGYRHLLNGDYHRPTGNPERWSDHAQVAWSDGAETVEMHFNAGAGPRSASIELG